MNSNKITFIDQTIREGMLFHGLVFSLEERIQMLDFQEQLGVQISQVAYPVAHISEFNIIKSMCDYANKKRYNIQVAGHARALIEDVEGMVEAGCQYYHLHTGVNPVMLNRLGIEQIEKNLQQTVLFIRKTHPRAGIKVSLLDVAHSERVHLEGLIQLLAKDLEVNIITLPDTSGAMLPSEYEQVMRSAFQIVKNTDSQLAAHCHNDLGMASANVLAGIEAGASIAEVTVFGIGERNGIADFAMVSQILQKAGYSSGWNNIDPNILSAYYYYVNGLIEKKIGFSLIHYETPLWGKAISTMGAGSHGIAEYGIMPSTQFFLNHMCGRSLVKRYLDSSGINCKESDLRILVQQIKDSSVEKQRALILDEIKALIPK